MSLQIQMYNSVEVSGSRLPEHLPWQGGSRYRAKAAVMSLNSSLKGWSLCRAYHVLYDIFRAALNLEIMVIWSLNILIGEEGLLCIVRHSATSLSFLYGVLVAAALKDSCCEVSLVDTSWPWKRSSIYFLTCKVDLVQFIQPRSVIEVYICDGQTQNNHAPWHCSSDMWPGFPPPQNLLRIARNVNSVLSSWPAPWEHPQLFLFSLLESIIVSKILLVCDGFNLQISLGIITLLVYLSQYLEALCH